ncbi:MAG: hypothetical protein PHP45_09270, partial [Elusimicrobiales bacterium]|nr:hypothetical protein [Elusimicrobiales bacterium]
GFRMRSRFPFAAVSAVFVLMACAQPVFAAASGAEKPSSYALVEGFFNRGKLPDRTDLEGHFSGRMFKKQSPQSANGSILIGYDGKYNKRQVFKVLIEHAAGNPAYYDNANAIVVNELMQSAEKKQFLMPAASAAHGLLSVEKSATAGRAGYETVREIRKYGQCLVAKEGKTAEAYTYYCKKGAGADKIPPQTVSRHDLTNKKSPPSDGLADSAPPASKTSAKSGGAVREQSADSYKTAGPRAFSEFQRGKRFHSDPSYDGKPGIDCQWTQYVPVVEAFGRGSAVTEEDINGWIAGRAVIKFVPPWEALIVFQKVRVKDRTVIAAEIFDHPTDSSVSYANLTAMQITKIETQLAFVRDCIKAHPENYSSEFTAHGLMLTEKLGTYAVTKEIRKYADCLVVKDEVMRKYSYYFKKVRAAEPDSEPAEETKKEN